MIRFSIILICVILTLSGCSRNPPDYIDPPKLSSINIVDRNGLSETISQADRIQQYENVDFFCPQPYQKVLRIFARNQTGDICARITSYHPNAQLKQYLEVVNNRALGMYREWYVNGTLKLETSVIGGVADLTVSAEQSWLFDGCSQVWDENGNVIATIEYSKGELEGVSNYYHCNGKIWKRIPYCRNKTEGVFEIYLDNGSLFQTIEYSNDVKNGKAMRYWGDGSVASDEDYCNGLLMEGRYYNACGELVAEILEGHGFRAIFGKESVGEFQEFHAGLQDGEVKVFDNRSSVMNIHRIKNGLKQGEEIEYYELQPGKQLQPKLSVMWYEGKIQGIVKSWYANGVQESQREMSGNTKTGMLTAWYKDGSLMLIEDYDRDKLIKGKYFKKGEKSPVSEVIGGNGNATFYDENGSFIRKLGYLNYKPQE